MMTGKPAKASDHPVSRGTSIFGLLHQRITVLEQVQTISGHHVVSAPKSAASHRSVALPGVATAALE
jgi:hypothetical protein